MQRRSNNCSKNKNDAHDLTDARGLTNHNDDHGHHDDDLPLGMTIPLLFGHDHDHGHDHHHHDDDESAKHCKMVVKLMVWQRGSDGANEASGVHST